MTGLAVNALPCGHNHQNVESWFLLRCLYLWVDCEIQGRAFWGEDKGNGCSERVRGREGAEIPTHRSVNEDMQINLVAIASETIEVAVVIEHQETLKAAT